MEDCVIKVSIITASYNYASLINETIESVLAQTYPNWELVIVDDGSKDNSVEVIKKYCEKDSRIKLFQHKNGENKGLIKTIQLGIEKASSDWIAFLESDDVFAPNYLEEKVKSLNKYPDAGFIFNDVEYFGDIEKIKGYESWYSKPRKEILSESNLSYFDFFNLNVVPTFSCVMLKKDLLKDCNFDSPEPQSIDWLLWTQIFSKTKVIHINQNISKWRLHPNSYINTVKSNNLKNKHNKLKALLLKYLTKNNFSNLIFIYELINSPFFEKLLRPQVCFLSKYIKLKLLKDKYFNIINI